jgi:general stress protein 26
MRSDAGRHHDGIGHLVRIFEKHASVLLFDHAMDGKLQGRPMVRERIDPDGTMYFTARADSKKIAELTARPEVTLAVQAGNEHAVVSGRASIRRDQALIDTLYRSSWKVWFPHGRTDANIAIIVVTPEEGTYWDQTRGQGLSFLFRLAKARLTGSRMETRPGDAQHVTMR